MVVVAGNSGRIAHDQQVVPAMLVMAARMALRRNEEAEVEVAVEERETEDCLMMPTVSTLQDPSLAEAGTQEADSVHGHLPRISLRLQQEQETVYAAGFLVAGKESLNVLVVSAH